MKKEFTCLYLFADGHAIACYEKRDKEAGTIQFVEIHEKFTDARLSFKGRIIVSRYNQALIDLMKRAKSIRADMPALSHGSDNTKKLGILVGNLTLEMENHSGRCLYFHDFPGTLSGSYTYQDNVEETFNPDITRWSGHNVAKIHRVKQDKQTVQA